jgi:hypothetical protein
MLDIKIFLNFPWIFTGPLEFLNHQLWTRPNSLFDWETASVDTSCPPMPSVCSLNNPTASGQSESVLNSPCLYLLVPIGWMCCSAWSPAVTGVALGVIWVRPVLHSPLSSCKRRNPQMKATPANIREQLVWIRERLVPIEEQLVWIIATNQ